MEEKVFLMSDLEELRHAKNEEVYRLSEKLKDLETEAQVVNRKHSISDSGVLQAEIIELKKQVESLLSALTEQEAKNEKLSEEVS